MIDHKAAEAMKTAIEMEKSGHRFFTEAAGKVRNEAGRKVFTRLAAEEINHMHVFSKIFAALSQGADWQKAVAEVRPTKHVPYFDDARQQFKAGDLSVELEFLRKALDLERNAIAFFDKAAREAESAEAREVFQRIMEEEQGHYDLIQAEIDSVNGSGYWFDIQEFNMDGKF